MQILADMWSLGGHCAIGRDRHSQSVLRLDAMIVWRAERASDLMQETHCKH
jgi:hypothetical protein